MAVGANVCRRFHFPQRFCDANDAGMVYEKEVGTRIATAATNPSDKSQTACDWSNNLRFPLPNLDISVADVRDVGNSSAIRHTRYMDFQDQRLHFQVAGGRHINRLPTNQVVAPKFERQSPHYLDSKRIASSAATLFERNTQGSWRSQPNSRGGFGLLRYLGAQIP